MTASRKNIHYRSRAFTEHGVAMLSSVLKSERAIEVNIAIVRAFVRLREILSTQGSGPKTQRVGEETRPT